MMTSRNFRSTASLAVSLIGLTACTPDARLLLAGGTLVAGSPGALKVEIQRHVRSVQAVAADVDHIALDLQLDGWPDRQRTLSHSDLLAGNAAAEFDGLVSGDATVSAIAYDAGSRKVGSASTTATIKSGEEAMADLNLQLAPTYLAAGELDAKVSLTDGPNYFFDPDHLPTARTVAGGLTSPEDVAADGAGNLYVANLNANSVSKIHLEDDGSATVKTLSNGIPFPHGVAVDSQGDVWISRRIDHHSSSGDVAGTQIYRIDPAGNILTVSAVAQGANPSGFSYPTGIAIDAKGLVYVANTSHWKGYILRLDPSKLPSGSGQVTVDADVFVGTDAKASDSGAGLSLPGQMHFAQDGRLLVADGSVLAVTPDGELSTFASVTVSGLAIGPRGSVYLSNNWGDGQHRTFFKFRPSGTMVYGGELESQDGTALNPSGMAFASDGNLYVAEYLSGNLARTLPFIIHK